MIQNDQIRQMLASTSLNSYMYYFSLFKDDNWCGLIVTTVEPGTTLSVTSPSFPDVYPFPAEGITCSQHFPPPPGYQLYFHFRFFDVGDGVLNVLAPFEGTSFTGSDINDVTSDEHVSLVFYLTNTTVGYWMEISAINITCKF